MTKKLSRRTFGKVAGAAALASAAKLPALGSKAQGTQGDALRAFPPAGPRGAGAGFRPGLHKSLSHKDRSRQSGMSAIFRDSLTVSLALPPHGGARRIRRLSLV